MMRIGLRCCGNARNPTDLGNRLHLFVVMIGFASEIEIAGDGGDGILCIQTDPLYDVYQVLNHISRDPTCYGGRLCFCILRDERKVIRLGGQAALASESPAACGHEAIGDKVQVRFGCKVQVLLCVKSSAILAPSIHTIR